MAADRELYFTYILSIFYVLKYPKEILKSYD